MQDAARFLPAINHVLSAFIENKRYRTNQGATAGMVNRNGSSVYRTDQTKPVQSTSMSRNVTLALLAGASFLSIGIDSAAAFDRAAAEPNVIYANDPQATSVRSAYAERSNMGGGFIQFLFGDGPQARRYQQEQEPAYQQQPSYYVPQVDLPGGQPRAMLQQEQAAGAQRPFDPKFEKQEVEYHGHESAGTIVIDTPNKFLFLVQGNGR